MRQRRQIRFLKSLTSDRSHTLVEGPGGPRYNCPMAEASPEPLTFLIADDHPMVRDALHVALKHAFPGAATSFAGTLGEAQAALERQPETDALLLDLDMPGMDGLTGLALLRSGHPTVPIVVVSAARDSAVVRRSHDLGAAAYIDKSAPLNEITNTVRAVLAGEIFAPPEASIPDSFAQRAAQLTPQQWRVLALMVHGDQNKQIAHKLGVGEATVKAHVTVILRKLGVRSRTQAVIEARHLALPANLP
jgi:DNA-binding NarL/FixJ family response regulator